MEMNEIVSNEEIVETADEIVEAASGRGAWFIGGFGLGVVVGIVAYEYAVKPMIARIRARKECSSPIDAEFSTIENENDGDVESDESGEG